jgi:hypothetical protein
VWGIDDMGKHSHKHRKRRRRRNKKTQDVTVLRIHSIADDEDIPSAHSGVAMFVRNGSLYASHNGVEYRILTEVVTR